MTSTLNYDAERCNCAELFGNSECNCTDDSWMDDLCPCGICFDACTCDPPRCRCGTTLIDQMCPDCDEIDDFDFI